MGRDVRLRVSIFVELEDPMVKIQHIVHLEALLLTFPEGMPLPGIRREAGAAVKSFVQCIPKVGSYITSLALRHIYPCAPSPLQNILPSHDKKLKY